MSRKDVQVPPFSLSVSLGAAATDLRCSCKAQSVVWGNDSYSYKDLNLEFVLIGRVMLLNTIVLILILLVHLSVDANC